MATCPDICPAGGPGEAQKSFLKAGQQRPKNPHGAPYTPGQIKPPKKVVIPAGAPPLYLPQSTDSTSGDFLSMGPVGPWASGQPDWTPQAGITGVRPVVDKYSITRYSTGEWRKNNQYTLTPRAPNKAIALEKNIDDFLQTAFKTENEKQALSNKKIQERVKELTDWNKRSSKAVDEITKEINNLDADREKLKGACRILMLPEAISKECLELRTHRYEPDMVRDDAEQELIKEVAIVGEIRKLFQETLAKVEKQMEKNKAMKTCIESDWCDKMVTLYLDSQNASMGNDSTLILKHPGVSRWPENATSMEYWKHFCHESIRNCDDVRKESENLRNALTTIIKDGSQDMKLQADRTNAALAAAIDATQKVCDKLEEALKSNLQKTVDIENLIDTLNDKLRDTEIRNKLVMTRLHNRNYSRPNVENCRDDAQYALMDESKYVKETILAINDKIREALFARMDLMKNRGELEKDIACKRKSLSIDQDRLARVRAHMPTPEEFANA